MLNEYFDTQEAKRFFKFSTLAVLLLSLFLLAQTLGALKDWRAPEAAYSTIVVSGTGEAYATPDIASFSFSVSADADSVAEAQETVTKNTDKVLAALEALEIEEKDIRTTDYSVYPKYVYMPIACTSTYCPPSRQVPDGYTVTHTVTIKVRNTDNAGKALAAAGENGATNISGLNFTIDNPDLVYHEARTMAVEEARQKAKLLAKSLDVRLGRVVDFSDNSYMPSPYYLKNEVAAGFGGADTQASSPTVPQGENKFTSNVTITYEIR